MHERFVQLTELLKAGELFWRHHAFKYLAMPWEKQFPNLAQELRRFSLTEAERLASDDQELYAFLATYSPLFAQINAQCAVGGFDKQPLPDVEPYDVPGRKWQQIRYFAPCIPDNDFSLLEWCSGKSHLGRLAAYERGCEIKALEYNADLIEAGKQLAARDKVTIDFHCVDAMTDIAANVIEKKQNAIALHACGDLHKQLLRFCVQKQTATITVAPCCYQLIKSEADYLLSQAAAESGLCLQRDDLRTAVQGSVTASARENRLRQKLQAWRLGFDLLQREVCGVDEYLPTPSLSIAALNDGFPSFCRKVSAMKNVALPDTIDFTHYECAGGERMREVTALDLPRIAFRRALELWLVLDRALFLQEKGYSVQVGVFCPRVLTPRNIVVKAIWPSAHQADPTQGAD